MLVPLEPDCLDISVDVGEHGVQFSTFERLLKLNHCSTAWAIHEANLGIQVPCSLRHFGLNI